MGFCALPEAAQSLITLVQLRTLYIVSHQGLLDLNSFSIRMFSKCTVKTAPPPSQAANNILC